jgi:hypothetical protein
MSNHLAVATVTAALSNQLSRLLPDDLRQANVRSQKPPTEPPSEPTITVFCYQVTVNGALRNRDAPTRSGTGTLITRPQVGLDLHYLLSFYGEETRLEPQRLLGAAVRALHQEPVLSGADITAATTQLPFLNGSDLLSAQDRVRFTPTHLDIDDLYKLWSMLSGTPFALSLCYLASVVAIDGLETPVPGRPVEQRVVRAEPFEVV